MGATLFSYRPAYLASRGRIGSDVFFRVPSLSSLLLMRITELQQFIKCNKMNEYEFKKTRYAINTTNLISIVVAWVVMSVSPVVIAQSKGDTSSSVLEEVIVTAQKREQKLSDVGISVTAFTANR